MMWTNQCTDMLTRKKKLILRCLSCISVVFLIVGCNTAGDATARTFQTNVPLKDKPNILFIVFEDMSPRIGVYGDDVAQTPVLNAFAKQSILYQNVFTSAGVCAPSRASLITGHYQQTIGAQHMRTANGKPIAYEAVPPANVKAFPELLRRAGYYTTNSGGYGPNHAKTDYQFGNPFTIWDEQVAKHPWKGRRSGQPFFAMVNILGTHESQTWPSETEATMPFIAGILEAIRSERQDRVPIIDPSSVPIPSYLPDTVPVRRDIAQHYDNIHYMERKVEELLEMLESDGLADETIVIVTTDHGDGLPRMKRSLYDSGLHVPMMIRFPSGYGAGTSRDELVSFVDIAPTLLSLAGAPVPLSLPGRNFVGEDTPPEREFVYAALDRHDNVPDRMRAVRDKRWKYIRNYNPNRPFFRRLPFRDVQPTMAELWRLHDAGKLNDIQRQYFIAPRPEEELYDTLRDPEEIKNLASKPEYGRQLTRMRKAYSAFKAKTTDRSDLSEEEMIYEMWPGGQQPMTAAPSFEIVEGEVVIRTSTEGASIGYRFEGDERWLLYQSPIRIGARSVEAKAIRYGFKESAIKKLESE